MARIKSYIEKITPFIDKYRYHRDEDVKPVPPTPPTPGTLVAFTKPQTIKGFDFGSVANGDTNAALDTFLLGLEVDMNSEPLMTGTNDVMLLATHIVVPDEQIDAGLIFGGDFDHDVPGDIVVYYSTSPFSYEGITATQGYQNLTDGKYGFINPESTSDTYTIRDDENVWNGIFVGAVVAEPGPTPPGPTPPTTTSFQNGQKVYQGDKVYVDTTKATELQTWLSTNVNADNPQVPMIYAPQSTGGQAFVLMGMYADGGYGVMAVAGQNMIMLYNDQDGFNESGLVDSCFVIPEEAGQDYDYTVSTISENDSWNGTIFSYLAKE